MLSSVWKDFHVVDTVYTNMVHAVLAAGRSPGMIAPDRFNSGVANKHLRGGERKLSRRTGIVST